NEFPDSPFTEIPPLICSRKPFSFDITDRSFSAVFSTGCLRCSMCCPLLLESTGLNCSRLRWHFPNSVLSHILHTIGNMQLGDLADHIGSTLFQYDDVPIPHLVPEYAV